MLVVASCWGAPRAHHASLMSVHINDLKAVGVVGVVVGVIGVYHKYSRID
jgi:hypothetical protein